MNDSQYIIPPCSEAVNILFEDDYLLLVEKPSGLLSIPGRNPANWDCVAHRVKQTHPEARIVHRLDLDTSGIMVMALDRTTHRELNWLFERRDVQKLYTAVVFGVMQEETGSVDFPLIADWPNRPRQKVCYERGKQALTYYEVVERDAAGNRTRLHLKPVTGRSHQLRVHMAEINHPILGCDMYAHDAALAMAERLQLHATNLSFRHPITGEMIEGVSPPPF